MIAATVWFVLGLVLLALGGDAIVRAASGLAQRFGARHHRMWLVWIELRRHAPLLSAGRCAMTM